MIGMWALARHGSCTQTTRRSAEAQRCGPQQPQTSENFKLKTKTPKHKPDTAKPYKDYTLTHNCGIPSPREDAPQAWVSSYGSIMNL